MSSSAALLLSGGMDSATCLWWIKKQVTGDIFTIAVDYHQRHRIELEYAARLSARAGARGHKVIELDLTSIAGNPLTDARVEVPAARDRRQGNTVVPMRNMLLVTAAAAYAETRGIHDLYIAPVRDDREAYRDCRREFYDILEQALRLGASQPLPFKVHTPFVEKWKTEVIALGLDLGVPYELTHTCYQGRRPACGRCDACAERVAAFRANEVRDPLDYEVQVPWRGES